MGEKCKQAKHHRSIVCLSALGRIRIPVCSHVPFLPYPLPWPAFMSTQLVPHTKLKTDLHGRKHNHHTASSTTCATVSAGHEAPSSSYPIHPIHPVKSFRLSSSWPLWSSYLRGLLHLHSLHGLPRRSRMVSVTFAVRWRRMALSRTWRAVAGAVLSMRVAPGGKFVPDDAQWHDCSRIAAENKRGTRPT